jgi:hypothetical protein
MFEHAKVEKGEGGRVKVREVVAGLPPGVWDAVVTEEALQ